MDPFASSIQKVGTKNNPNLPRNESQQADGSKPERHLLHDSTTRARQRQLRGSPWVDPSRCLPLAACLWLAGRINLDSGKVRKRNTNGLQQ